MRVIELRLTDASPQSRGEAYGTSVAVHVRDVIERYRQAYATLGVPAGVAEEIAAASIAPTRVWAPEQAAELDGIAAGAGVPLLDLMLLNARTEILSHAPAPPTECSTVVALHPGRHPQTLQTWDWNGDLVPTAVLLEGLVGGRVVRTFAEAGMLGKIGVARQPGSPGLGVHFNILHHRSDRSAVGVPVHVVMRRILDEARDLDEAIAIARSAPLGASTVLTVIEGESERRHARAASLELSPAGVGVVEPDGGFLAHTNHYLDPALAEGEAARASSTTWRRLLHTLVQREPIMAATDAVAMAGAMCGSAGADAPVCVVAAPDAAFAERWSTLLTASLDVEAAAIDWFAGPPSGLTAATVRRFP
ncbi:isopenicillin-N N-acyltransferase like protein [Agrococcus baldri]|uniref:Isopenicillin-N N-acyltransferase like protein n=1 Tax=Agrococcus baldri TaxID=153730 RepID=A0AA94KZF1_9MICO|nr:C45 family peptidase [Agrococcus baldri]SFS09359.1 isopenicillin-N N-acyltransferase like protein [Agrococcus baldri]